MRDRLLKVFCRKTLKSNKITLHAPHPSTHIRPPHIRDLLAPSLPFPKVAKHYTRLRALCNSRYFSYNSVCDMWMGCFCQMQQTRTLQRNDDLAQVPVLEESHQVGKRHHVLRGLLVLSALNCKDRHLGPHLSSAPGRAWEACTPP